MAENNWEGDTTPLGDCGDNGKCTAWTKAGCQMGYCPTTDGCVAVSYNQFPTAYRLIKSWCMPDDLGGRNDLNVGYFQVMLNRNNKKFRRGIADPVYEQQLTREEYDELFGNNNTAAVNNKRDTTYTNYLTQKGVTKDGLRYQASQEMDAGTEQTWSEATSVSVSVSVTAGVSVGFFEIFTASMEISTSYEETHTITKQLTFTSGDCPGSAIVYWEPLFDKYTGAFSDQPDVTQEIWVSRTFQGEAEGRFVTDCIGSGKKL